MSEPFLFTAPSVGYISAVGSNAKAFGIFTNNTKIEKTQAAPSAYAFSRCQTIAIMATAPPMMKKYSANFPIVMAEVTTRIVPNVNSKVRKRITVRGKY